MKNEKEHFQCLRVLISLAHIDSKICPSEMCWLKNFIRLHIKSDEYLPILLDDLNNPPIYAASFREIENYFARERILDFARHLFQVDNEYSSDEKAAYQQLLKIHNELSPNIKSEQTEAAKGLAEFAKEQKFYRDLEYSGKFLGQKRYYHSPLHAGGSIWLNIYAGTLGLSLLYGRKKAVYIILFLAIFLMSVVSFILILL